MWGLVENLGLKEGLAEFTDQFNKDAKKTIADQKWAKDRGIDVAQLDQWEQKLQEQTHEAAAELHDRTIGLAVETLAQDDTLAQLLELRPVEADENVHEAMPDEEQPANDTSSAARGEDAHVIPDHLQRAEQPEAPGSCRDPQPGSTERQAEASAAPASLDPGVVPVAFPPAATAVPVGRTAAGTTSHRQQKDRVRQFEAEVSTLKTSRDEAQRELARHRTHAEDLEARLAEMSGVSDEALSQAEEAKNQVFVLRRAVEEKDSKVLEATEAQAQLGEELAQARRKLQDAEASFQERLTREVSQKEQELLDEVAYLRKTGDAKEKRAQDLQAEKAGLERRLLVKARDTSGGDVMLEAHTAIARAFGDLSMEHPCLRFLDEPTLKLMAVLFKQAAFRRIFFVATLFIWVFALYRALTPGSGQTVIV